MNRIASKAAGIVPGLAVLLLALAPAQSRAITFFSWNSPVTGSADDPARWNPSGVPNWDSNVSILQPGTYTVLFPGSVPQSRAIFTGGGNLTINVDISGPHSTTGLNAAAGNTTIGNGRLNANYLHLGQFGAFSSLTLDGFATEVHSRSIDNPKFAGDLLGYEGVSQFYIQDGARYYVDNGNWPVEIASKADAASTVAVTGSGNFGNDPSRMILTGTPGLVIGASGVANFFATEGGYADVAGDIYVARDPGSSGYVTIGPGAPGLPSHLTARSNLLIGKNFGYNGGRAEFTVRERAHVDVAALTDIGDPEGDNGCVLRVLEGARFTTSGGLRVWNTPGLGLDLRGGITHVRGGNFTWPAGRMLKISSQVGTPELWIANGMANTGPHNTALISQLMIGRGGYGALRVTRPGTVFSTGAGVTTLGDSLGGVGALVVDSSAAFNSTGDLYVGSNGNGAVTVKGGSSASVRLLGLGAGTTGNGSVVVKGAGSRLDAVNSIWVGGASFGPGTTGTLEVDSMATVTISPAGFSTATLTVYPTVGTVAIANGGALNTQWVDNRGNLRLSGGSLHSVTVVNAATGDLSGWGRLTGHVINANRIRPLSSLDDFGKIAVQGNLTMQPAGRYEVTLGSMGGRRCDTLSVSGTAALNGTLEIRLDPSFVRTPGDTFEVLTAANVTGTFAEVTWLGNPLGGQAEILYSPGSVKVVIGAGTVGVESTPAAAAAVRFAAASARSSLSFTLELPEAAEVEIELYDVGGRRVATPFSGRVAAGPRRIEVPSSVRGLASGLYFARASIRAQGWTAERLARATLLH